MPGNSYECVDIEMAPTKPVAAIKCKVDLYWTDVCYNIVSSCILKQCWGKVVIFFQSMYFWLVLSLEIIRYRLANFVLLWDHQELESQVC